MLFVLVCMIYKKINVRINAMPVQKIKVGDLIENLVNDAKSIEQTDEPQMIKTQKFQRLAKSFMNKLYGDKRKRVQQKIAISTARSYLTKARKAVGVFLGLHHRFNDEVNRLVKRYPSHEKQLSSLLSLTPEETRIQKKALLTSLLESNELAIEVNALDFSKPGIKKRVEQLAEKHPLYLDEITVMNSDSFAGKNSLLRTLNEAESLYGDIKKLKVDHELIVNLAMNDADKDTLSNKASVNLNKKKNTVVYVDYPRYLGDVMNILTRSRESFSGYTKEIAPLVFALCAATGRRPIEILYTGNLIAKKRHTLLFTGQAKKRDDEDEERLIYSLVDSAVVVAAFTMLRAIPSVQSLIKSSLEGNDEKDFRSINDRINTKVADTFNAFAKNFFIDKARVFKDTRGIYGRICHTRWYLNDVRWRNKDEDIFFSELFGHTDTKSQAHYKPYRLNNFNVDFEPSVLSNERWSALCELDGEMLELARGDAAVKIHNKVKELVLENDKILINQNVLIKSTGAFRGTIQKYLSVIDDLAEPGEALSVQHDEYVDDEQTEIKNTNVDTEKTKVVLQEQPVKKSPKDLPHLSSKNIGDDHWQVIIKLGAKTSSYDLYSKNRMDAQKTAYAIFVGNLFEFKVTIPFKKYPYFVENVYAVNEKAAEQLALNNAGLDGFKGVHDKIQVVKI